MPPAGDDNRGRKRYSFSRGRTGPRCPQTGPLVRAFFCERRSWGSHAYQDFATARVGPAEDVDGINHFRYDVSIFARFVQMLPRQARQRLDLNFDLS